MTDWNNKKEVLEEVQSRGRHGQVLQYVCEDLKADKEVVLAAVQQDGSALRYISKELKADQEVVLAAVQSREWAGQVLEYASDELKADREARPGCGATGCP